MPGVLSIAGAGFSGVGTQRSLLNSRRSFVALEPQGDFVLIQSQTVGSGGASSITFDNIPQGFQHLQIRGIARDSRTAFTNSPFKISMNSIASIYYHLLEGNGTTAVSSAGADSPVAQAASNNATSNIFGAFVIDILDYTSTSKNKTTRTLTGVDGNGSGLVHLFSTLWNSTSAVTSITFTPLVANFVQHSTFSLYGVR